MKAKAKTAPAAPTHYIFWAGETYPYVLGTPGFIESNGFARIPSQGMYVKPLKVCNLEEGNEIAQKLGQLKAQYAAAIQMNQDGFMARLTQAAAWAVPKDKKGQHV